MSMDSPTAVFTPILHTMVFNPKTNRAECIAIPTNVARTAQNSNPTLIKTAQEQLKTSSPLVQHSKSLLGKIIDVRRPNLMLGTLFASTLMGGLLGVAIKSKDIETSEAFIGNAIAGLVTSIAGSAFGALLMHNPKATILTTLSVSLLTFLTHKTVGIFKDISRDKAKKNDLKRIAIVVSPIFALNVLATIFFQRPIS